MNTPQKQLRSFEDKQETYIHAADLWEALDEKRNDFKADRWAIIKEIISAREQVEIFEAGGLSETSRCVNS